MGEPACPACGGPLTAGAKVCPKCGKKVAAPPDTKPPKGKALPPAAPPGERKTEMIPDMADRAREAAGLPPREAEKTGAGGFGERRTEAIAGAELAKKALELAGETPDEAKATQGLDIAVDKTAKIPPPAEAAGAEDQRTIKIPPPEASKSGKKPVAPAPVSPAEGEQGTIVMKDAVGVAKKVASQAKKKAGGTEADDADTRSLARAGTTGDEATVNIAPPPSGDEGATVNLGGPVERPSASAFPSGTGDTSKPTGVAAEASSTQGFNRGQRIGKYEILSYIAAGGMGAVYKAKDVTLGRVVALKVMKSGALASEEEKIRFLREAEAAAKLQHPNIVQVYDSGIANENYYFTMDYIEGKSLSKYAEEKGLDVRGIFQVMGKVSDAMGYAHLRGIIHRDLKPSNIFVDEAGEPHIMDFGLAKQVQVEEEGGQQITLSGVVMGTPHYMSPEQAEGLVKEIDIRSDIYTLGVILYELVGKELPFTGKNINAIFNQILLADPVSLRKRSRQADSEVEAIVEKAMAREKDRRYQSAMELRDDLRAYVEGRPISARKASTLYRARKFVQRHKVPVAAAFVSALAIFGALGYAGYLYWEEATKATRLNREVEERIAGLGPAIQAVEDGLPADEISLDEAAAIDQTGRIGAVSGEADAIAQDIGRLKDLDADQGRRREAALAEYLRRIRSFEARIQGLADAHRQRERDRETLDTVRGDYARLIADAAPLEHGEATSAELQDFVRRLEVVLASLGTLADRRYPEVRDPAGALRGEALAKIAEWRTAVTRVEAQERARERIPAIRQTTDDLASRTDALRRREDPAAIAEIDRASSDVRAQLDETSGFLVLGIDPITEQHERLLQFEAGLRDARARLVARQEAELEVARILGSGSSNLAAITSRLDDIATLGPEDVRPLQGRITTMREELIPYRAQVAAASDAIEALAPLTARLTERADQLRAIGGAEQTFTALLGNDPDARLAQWQRAIDVAGLEHVGEALSIGEVRDIIGEARARLADIRTVDPRYGNAYDFLGTLANRAQVRENDLRANAQAVTDSENDLGEAQRSLAAARAVASPIEGGRISQEFQGGLQSAMEKARAAYDRASGRHLGRDLEVRSLASYVEAVYRFAAVAGEARVFDLARFAANLLLAFPEADLTEAIGRARAGGVPIPEGFTPAAYVAQINAQQAAATGIEDQLTAAWPLLVQGLQAGIRARSDASARDEAARTLTSAGQHLETAHAAYERVRQTLDLPRDPRLDIGRDMVDGWTAQQAANFDGAIDRYARAVDVAHRQLPAEEARFAEWLQLARDDKYQALLAEVRALEQTNRQEALRRLQEEVLPFAAASGVAADEATQMATNIELQTLAPEWAAHVPGAHDFEIPVGDRTIRTEVSDFYVGRTEVQNRLFREFVAANGYGTPEWWAGTPSAETTVALFRDRTGTPGPASWVNGNYPEGADDLPVTGVSWYEAVAFTRWYTASKGQRVRLPTEVEWARVAFQQRSFPFVQSFAAWSAVFCRPDREPVPSTADTARYDAGVVDAVDLPGGEQVYHLYGNVQEWVLPADGVAALACTPERAPVRGGCYRSLTAERADPSRRVLLPRDWRPETTGFRMAVEFGDANGEGGGQ